MVEHPRHTLTLSDIPLPLHDWFREEAARRSQVEGKRVKFYELVVQAMRDYQARVEGINQPKPKKIGSDGRFAMPSGGQGVEVADGAN